MTGWWLFLSVLRTRTMDEACWCSRGVVGDDGGFEGWAPVKRGDADSAAQLVLVLLLHTIHAPVMAIFL